MLLGQSGNVAIVMHRVVWPARAKEKHLICMLIEVARSFFVESHCVPLRVKAQIPGPCPALGYSMCALQLRPKRKGGTTFHASCAEVALDRPG